MGCNHGSTGLLNSDQGSMQALKPVRIDPKVPLT